VECGQEFFEGTSQVSRVCISADYHLANVDAREFSIINFLQVATRKVGPNKGGGQGRRRNNGEEDFVSSFATFLAVLLANHSPASYIKNKRLYNLAVKYNKNKVGGKPPWPSLHSQ